MGNSNPSTNSDRSLANRFVPVIGPIVALALFTPLTISLVGLWQRQPATATVPAIFAVGVLICGILSLFQDQQVEGEFGWRQLSLISGFVLCGLAIWAGIPYIAATSLLIILCFAIVGRRSWTVMLGVWAGSQILAYGVFKYLLGIPIY